MFKIIGNRREGAGRFAEFNKRMTELAARSTQQHDNDEPGLLTIKNGDQVEIRSLKRKRDLIKEVDSYLE